MRSTFVLAAFLAGCAGVSGNAAAPREAAASTSQLVAFEVPLLREVRGKPIPVLAVSGAINAVPTFLIVDTGSSHHVLTNEFARKNGIKTGADGTGKDHANEAVKVKEVEPIQLTVGAMTERVSGALAIPGLPPFEPLGIGGFISPQRLLARGYVAMDFSAGKLIGVAGGSEQLKEWIASRYPGQQVVKVARRVGPNPGHLYVAMAVEGREEITGVIDTGSNTTELTTRYLRTDATPAVTDRLGIGGKAIEEVAVAGIRLRLGGQSFGPLTVSARREIQPHPEKPADGLLGMDVLKSAVLILPQSSDEELIFVFKDPPAGAARAAE